jgi:hypothetical protein
MAAIVYKSGSPPIWRQGGRTVETFRSGLIKTTDTYKTPIADIDESLATFAVGSAITGVSQAYDGVKIYPEPQWKDDGDGFATISVTGYGRTRPASGFTTEPRLTPGLLEEITTSLDPDPSGAPLVTTRQIQCTKTDFVCRYVLADGEEFLYGEFSTLRSRFIAYDREGEKLAYSRLTQAVSQPETNYFGSFTEVAAVVVYQPTGVITTRA